MGKRRKKAVQGELDFKSWGGPRRGAGRKPKGPRAGVPHREREDFRDNQPLHVTCRLAEGLPSLRGDAFQAVRDALAAGGDHDTFRVIEYSVQSNHLHLVIEATDRVELGRRMKGLCVRIARAVNRVWDRKGSVFGDRYHVHVLRSLAEVRNAVGYVLRNARKHGLRIIGNGGVDPCSSAPWFEGWTRTVAAPREGFGGATPRSWMLRVGWKRLGRLVPG